MSQQFVTLTRDDPEFESYLLGTFSKTERALPVETYQASRTQRERVTFRIVPCAEVEAPSWWRIYVRSCRPELAALTLGPAMAAWLNHRSSIQEWSRWPSWFALAGIFFLHTATFLLTDVLDHLRGIDRVRRDRGSRVIQSGWVSAAEMKRWAYLNLALAVAFGVPAFFSTPIFLAGVCGVAAVALYLLAYDRGTRYGLCDLAILLIFGPLLTGGVALASFARTDFRDLALGVAFGAMTLWVFQLRQFESLFRSKPQGVRTFLAYRNFESARTIAVIEGFVLLAIHPLAAVILRLPILFLALLPIVSSPSIFLINRLLKATSPLSSQLIGASRLALKCHLAWALWWLAALGAMWL